jgi:hypothetical protein
MLKNWYEDGVWSFPNYSKWKIWIILHLKI